MAREIAKSGVEKSASATAPARVPQAKPDSGTHRSSPVTQQQRQIMICEAAYYIAEHRGFEPGHDVDDWLAAEQQIDAALTRSVSRAADSPLRR